jgi:hypothetical protein
MMSRLVQLVRTTIHHAPRARRAHRGDPPPEVVAQRAALARTDYFTHVHEGA